MICRRATYDQQWLAWHRVCGIPLPPTPPCTLIVDTPLKPDKHVLVGSTSISNAPQFPIFIHFIAMHDNATKDASIDAIFTSS